MFYLFEFTIVSIFPYVSELVPLERGKWLAFNFSALGGGSNGRCTFRALAVATERRSLHSGGFFVTCSDSGGCSAAAQ